MRIIFFVLAFVATIPAYADTNFPQQYQSFKALRSHDTGPVPHVRYHVIARTGATDEDLLKARGIIENCLLLHMEKPSHSGGNANRIFNAEVRNKRQCISEKLERPVNADLNRRVRVRTEMLR